MKWPALLAVALLLASGQAQPPAAAPDGPPAIHTTLPPHLAPGLEKEVAGIKPLMLNLWEGDAPYQLKDAKPERDDGTGRIWDVNIPGMLVYLPSKEKLQASGGSCIIACMGGSYTHLTRLVGADNTVEPLMKQGIAVVSLKYRLKPPSTDPERDAVLDAKQAIRLVRAHAKEWNLDPQKVGLLGWSAGANLILSLATHPDETPRPIYPLSMQEAYSSRPDFIVMWSPWPNGKTIDAYSIPKDAPPPPPALLSTAQDDRTAPFPFAKGIQANWEKAGVPIAFVDIPTGGHGAFELNVGTAGNWIDKNLLPWLEKNGMWKRP